MEVATPLKQQCKTRHFLLSLSASLLKQQHLQSCRNYDSCPSFFPPICTQSGKQRL